MAIRKKKKKKKATRKDDPLDILGMKELTGVLEVSVNTVKRLIREENFPEPIKVGKSLRWFRDDVLKWLRNKERRA